MATVRTLLLDITALVYQDTLESTAKQVSSVTYNFMTLTVDTSNMGDINKLLVHVSNLFQALMNVRVTHAKMALAVLTG